MVHKLRVVGSFVFVASLVGCGSEAAAPGDPGDAAVDGTGPHDAGASDDGSADAAEAPDDVAEPLDVAPAEDAGDSATIEDARTDAVSDAAPSTGDYLIIDRSALMALPVSGAPWTAMKAAADATVAGNLCDQDNKANVHALAAALVYARTGNVAYANKVRDALGAMMRTQVPGCNNAILALGRQLGGWVMAADLVTLKTFAPAVDATFRTWLANIRTANLGGHGRWFELKFTAGDSASNWGTFALASMVAADRYLGDSAGIARDWAIFSGYGALDGWPFRPTASWSQDWSCPVKTKATIPIAINPVGCKLAGGFDGDGVPVEDASREVFPAFSGYIQESNQGYAVQALLLSRAGYPAFTVNSAQVCRAFKFANRTGLLTSTNVAHYVPFIANRFCALSLPTPTGTTIGRIFGFSDWLFAP